MGETQTIINFLVLIIYVFFSFLIYLFIGELISYMTSTQLPSNIHVAVKHADSICVQEERYIHLLYKILLAVEVYHLPHFYCYCCRSIGLTRNPTTSSSCMQGICQLLGLQTPVTGTGHLLKKRGTWY